MLNHNESVLLFLEGELWTWINGEKAWRNYILKSRPLNRTGRVWWIEKQGVMLVSFYRKRNILTVSKNIWKGSPCASLRINHLSTSSPLTDDLNELTCVDRNRWTLQRWNQNLQLVVCNDLRGWTDLETWAIFLKKKITKSFKLFLNVQSYFQLKKTYLGKRMSNLISCHNKIRHWNLLFSKNSISFMKTNSIHPAFLFVFQS